MSAVAAAMIGGSIISGSMSSNAARSAADTQANAANAASNAALTGTRETNALNWQMYQQNLANQSPYLQTGNLALSALSGGLGLGGPRTAPGTTAGNAGATGVPGVAGSTGGVQNYGASNADMAAASDRYGANGGQFTQTFQPSDLTMDPSYKWRLEQGNKNLSASAAARGMLGSGQNLKDITDYGQGAASQEYGNAYNRFMNNQNTLYNRLAGLAGVGQAATNEIGNQGAQTAGNIGANTMAGIGASNSALIGGANASAAGTMGQANAWGGAINSGISNWNTMQYLNKQPGYGGAGAGQGAAAYTPGLSVGAQGNYSLGTPIGG